MENYKKIVEQINAMEIEDGWSVRNRHSKEMKEANTKEEMLAIAERHDMENKIRKENIINRLVLVHNAEVAYITEVLPKVCAVYQKYAGKRVGERTEMKIRDEIYDTIGGHAFFNNDGLRLYAPVTNQCIQLYFGMYDDPDANYGKSTYKAYNDEGKLNKIEPEMFIYNKKYIEDIPGYIEQKKEQAARYVELSEQLNKAYHDYTDGLINGFECPDYGKIHTYLQIYR